MNVIDPNINPISSQFTNKAMKVAQTQIATVKSNIKETSGKSKGDKELVTDNDMVHLSDKGLEAAKQGEQATHSGTMSETAKKAKKKDVDERRVSVEDDLKEKGGTSGATVSGEEKTSEMDPAIKTKVTEIAQRKPEDIMDRDPKVPEGFATASKKIVEGQMKQGVPTEALTNLKDVPDPELALPSLKTVPNVDIAPIHDSDNKPISIPVTATAEEMKAAEAVAMQTPEARLDIAGENFGKAMTLLSPEERKDLRDIKAKVAQTADEEESKGKTVDRPTMFVADAMKYAGESLEKKPDNINLDNFFMAGYEFVCARHSMVEVLATDPASRAAGAQTQVQKTVENKNFGENAAYRRLKSATESFQK